MKCDHCPSCVNSLLLINTVIFTLAVTGSVTRLCWFGFEGKKKKRKRKSQECTDILPESLKGVCHSLA